MMNHKINKGFTERLRRSLKLRLRIPDIDSFLIKMAKTREELGDAFRLVYDEYEKSGYIQERKACNMFFHIHHLLPDTAIFLMIYKEIIVSTLSLVADTKQFFLPMDSIYHDELDDLRKNNRKVIEACSFATSESFRWTNIFSYLFRQVYWYAVHNGINDICIMVNPKHVRFYKKILLFEDLGVEKNYPRLGAPAFALKLNIDNYKERLQYTYKNYPIEYDLYDFIYENKDLSPAARKLLFDLEGHNRARLKVTRHFINALPPEQKDDFVQKMALSTNF